MGAAARLVREPFGELTCGADLGGRGKLRSFTCCAFTAPFGSAKTLDFIRARRGRRV